MFQMVCFSKHASNLTKLDDKLIVSKTTIDRVNKPCHTETVTSDFYSFGFVAHD